MIYIYAALFSLIHGSLALAQETSEAVQQQVQQVGLGEILLPFLPAGTAETLAIVFATVGALNATSIVLEKVAAKTATKKDDKAVAKLKSGIVTVQKVLNFFIAKR
jgi:hypothetical protein